MAGTAIQGITMPNGDQYDFFGRTYYGVCSTAAATAAKTVTISGFTSASLVAGVKVSVKFSYANRSAGATLNVSGTGAKVMRGPRISNTSTTNVPDGNPRWSEGEVIDFVYDGTYWCMIGGDQNTEYFYCDTAASTQAKVVSESPSRFYLRQGARVTIRFAYAQAFNGTPTLNVNGTGAKNIRVDGSTPAAQYEWSSGEILTFVYDGVGWVIVGRNRATTSAYGVTKLSSSYANNTATDVAVTPSAVNDLFQTTAFIGGAGTAVWNGWTPTEETLLDITIPAASLAEGLCRFTLSTTGQAWMESWAGAVKYITVTFGDTTIVGAVGHNQSYGYVTKSNPFVQVYIDGEGGELAFNEIPTADTRFVIKGCYDGMLVTPQSLSVAGYLTLDTLPIYEGTVV